MSELMYSVFDALFFLGLAVIVFVVIGALASKFTCASPSFRNITILGFAFLMIRWAEKYIVKQLSEKPDVQQFVIWCAVTAIAGFILYTITLFVHNPIAVGLISISLIILSNFYVKRGGVNSYHEVLTVIFILICIATWISSIVKSISITLLQSLVYFIQAFVMAVAIDFTFVFVATSLTTLNFAQLFIS